jgi:translation initiation factor IF-1
MAKEELIQFEGLVTEILPDARYRVQLDAGHEIVAYTAGKMKKNRIKTLAGDRVTIEMSPYDLEKGRLIFRHKDERPGGGGHDTAHNAIVPLHMATAARQAACGQKNARLRIVLGAGFA